MDFRLLYNRVMFSVIILLVGLIIGKFAQKITLKFMEELEITYLFKKTTKLKVSLDTFVSSSVKYLVYFLSLILVLNTLGFLYWSLIVIGVLALLFFITGAFLYLISLFPNLFARFKLRKYEFETGKTLEVKNIKNAIKSSSTQFIFLDNGIRLPYYYLLKNKFKIS